MKVHKNKPEDIPAMIASWNEVVEAGDAFPQEELLDEETGAKFFAKQSRTAVAENEGEVPGLYILHPNNIARCAHIANASYAVSSTAREKDIEEALVFDSLRNAKALGFHILQFNAVVERNIHARHLYERIGFQAARKDSERIPDEKREICEYLPVYLRSVTSPPVMPGGLVTDHCLSNYTNVNSDKNREIACTELNIIMSRTDNPGTNSFSNWSYSANSVDRKRNFIPASENSSFEYSVWPPIAL